MTKSSTFPQRTDYHSSHLGFFDLFRNTIRTAFDGAADAVDKAFGQHLKRYDLKSENSSIHYVVITG